MRQKKNKVITRATAPLPSPRKGSPHFMLPAILLAVAVLLLYGGALNYPLVFDDGNVLNPAVLKQYGASWFRLDLRWFSYASFGWTYNLVGADWFWHRLVNLLLHVATAILMFAFFSRLFGATLPTPAVTAKAAGTDRTAFFAALFFAVHPVAVYGVEYLVERSIVMATLFGVAMLLCYLEGLQRGGARWFIASSVFYFLAVFSKEHAVMLPAVAVVLTLLLHRPSLELAKKLWPVFSSFAVIAVAVVLKSKGVIGAPYEPFAAQALAGMSESRTDFQPPDAYLSSVINQGYLFFEYLLLWIVPNPGWMSVDMRQPFPSQWLSWPQTAGFVAFLLYPLVGCWLLLKRRETGLLGFGLLYPWLLFLTEISTVRIQEPFVLYRSYLWMSGLPAVLPFALMRLAPRWRTILPLLLCLLLVPLSMNRLDTFSDVFKLWDDAVRKNGDNSYILAERAYDNRGVANLRAGRYLEALQDINHAIQLNRNDAEAYVNRGTVHLRTSSLQDALDDFDKAIALDPGMAEAFAQRCVTYYKQSRLQLALPDCDRALAIDPGHGDAYSNRGIIHAMELRYHQALADLDKAVELNPQSPQARFNRGQVLRSLGRQQEAADNFSASCEMGYGMACEQMQQAPGG